MRKGSAVSLFLAALTLHVSSAWAETSEAPMDAQAEIAALKARLSQLEQKENENWLTAERATQIRQIVNEAIADAKTRGQFLDGGLQAGYKNGFFIQDGDKFKLVVGGYMQARYSFDKSEVNHEGAYADAPVGGDANGFDFRRARLIFSGNAFDPNLTFMIAGDFAGAASNSADFQLLDYYTAYKFNQWFTLRGGAFLVPFSYAEYTTAGAQGTDVPTILAPFDPVRSLGASVLGQPVADKLSYEFMINDGSKANTAGRVDETATGKLDNRLGFYSRLQWAGNGTLTDFADEPDYALHDNLVWMLGGAAGYESQNSSSSAFPSAQKTATIIGLPNAAGGGFLTPFNLNGDIYRATVDAHAKYKGWAAHAAGFFQQINDNPPAGSTTDTFVRTNGDSSLFMTGYYAQLGYFLVPRKFEVYGRFGQLLSEGLYDRMEEYSLGANYYIYGHNLKLQGDVTYIPCEAAYSDSAVQTTLNTQDILARVQLQLRF